ncbi:MAG: putative O-glycosylation ligase, exosortase A system-associated [Planctomycetes bacterium]|nr:putative O-glycosylation ligase, exosortase A system-associated [Planctomycetota bacterium]
MRDLIIALLILSTLPAAFRRPFVGLCVFSWLAYMRPQDLCWGFARSLRLSFLAGITMMAGYFAFEFGKRSFTRSTGRGWLMIGVLVCVTASLFVAYEVDEYVMTYYSEFVKIIAIALFTIGQVDTKQRLRAVLWIIALSLGFYGVKGGLWGVMTGGVIKQGPGGMMGDNNDFALAMVMNLPILFYMSSLETNRILKLVVKAMFFFSCVTILLTHSRGGFLSMVIVFMVLAWRSGKLFQAGFALSAAAVAFLLFAPDHVLARLGTLEQGGQESSAGARLKSWTVALRIIKARPLLGVGLRNFQAGYEEFGSEFLAPGIEGHVAHNSYLQIWAEHGTFAITLYMMLLISMFLGAQKLRRMARGRPDLAWAETYARMFEATNAGFMFGAFFLNRGHFDLTYHLFALMTCALYVTRKHYAAGPSGEDSEGVPMQTGAGPIRVAFRRTVPTGLPRWGRVP